MTQAFYAHMNNKRKKCISLLKRWETINKELLEQIGKNNFHSNIAIITPNVSEINIVIIGQLWSE
jgi:hypothetical protein